MSIVCDRSKLTRTDNPPSIVWRQGAVSMVGGDALGAMRSCGWLGAGEGEKKKEAKHYCETVEFCMLMATLVLKCKR